MYGQMTAGSWIYIGTQGILQGTYETFAAAGEQHWGTPIWPAAPSSPPAWAGWAAPSRWPPRWPAPRAWTSRSTRTGSSAGSRRATSTRWPTTSTTRWRGCARTPPPAAASRSALLGNAADVFAELARRGVQFDLVTDQTSAHDMLNGYVPAGMPLAEALALRESDPDEYMRRARATAVRHVQAMLELQEARQPRLRLRQQPAHRGPRRRRRGRVRLPGLRARRTSGRCSARGRGRSGGRRSRATRPTSPASTRRCSRPSPTTSCCSAGCALAPSGSRSRACRRGSAGSATATAPRPG